jgi:starch synthase
MRVAGIASEIGPFSKTGGLGDVIGALPRALADLGVEMITISPLYRSVRQHPLERTSLRIEVPVGDLRISASVFRSGTSYFLDHPPFFDREGIYGTAHGDYPDNASRFVFLCRGALELLKILGPPDILHAHDWPAGLVAAYAKTLYQRDFARARVVFTIHNLAYRGLFGHWELPQTGLPWSQFHPRALEFYGHFSFLKAGLVYADLLTTVSPTYAREIQTPEYGCGLDGVLRERAPRLRGILNGVDYAEWDPERDPFLAAGYSARHLGGKAKCKEDLQRRLGLSPDPRVPLIGMVSRLSEQKGIDLAVEVIDALAERPSQFVLMGVGEAPLEQAVRAAAARHPGKVSARIDFDVPLSHQIEAGSDLYLMPSRYEPCGLNQIYSLRYGAVPVVRATGGLADTVRDGETGFSFKDFTKEACLRALERALGAFADPGAFGSIQQAGMRQDFGWEASARGYLELFQAPLPGAG